MNRHQGRRCLLAIGCLATFLFVPTASAQAGTVFDAEADFGAGFTTGTNPNGVWSYGWSSSLLQPLNLYTVHETITFGFTFESWHDPTNYRNFTPAVYEHVGGAYFDGNVDIPAGGLLVHYGGTNFTSYSHVVFTAPSSAFYDVDMSLIARQVNVNSDAHVFDNGSSLLSFLFSADGQSTSYTGTVFLNAGDTLDFTTGPGTLPGNPHPGTIQLSGTITELDNTTVPEPASLLVFGGLGTVMGLGVMRGRWRRRRNTEHWVLGTQCRVPSTSQPASANDRVIQK
jgi:hypothetical protein